MGIHSINNYSEFTSYKITSIPRVNVEEAKKQDLQPKQTSLSTNENIHEAPEAIKPRQDAALEDISITFNKQDGFDSIGRNSDIESLDIEKAVSDMKKDQVLQQYNYFVGNSSTPLVDNADGLVFAKF